MVAQPWLSISGPQQQQEGPQLAANFNDDRSRSRLRRGRCKRHRYRMPPATNVGRRRRGDSAEDDDSSSNAENSVQLLQGRSSIAASRSHFAFAIISQLRLLSNNSQTESIMPLRGLAATLFLGRLDCNPFVGQCVVLRGICQRWSAADFINLDSANTLNSNASTRRFIAQMLAAHNEYRAQHQSPPLRHSEELTRQAQAWADMLAKRDALAYDLKCDDAGIGENVARKCDIGNSEATAQEFVDTWYGEVHNFNWRSLEDQFECSHFAQVVWRASREAGFGRAFSVSGCVYVVGRYRPMGNNSGEFPRNVLPRVAKSRTSATNHRVSRLSNLPLPDKRSEAPPAPAAPARNMSPAAASQKSPALRKNSERDSLLSPSKSPAGSGAPSAPVSTAALFGMAAKSAANKDSKQPSAPSTKSLFSALGAKTSASPAPAPVSSMSLFGALKSNSKGAAALESPSTKSLFGALAAKNTLGGLQLRDNRRASPDDLEEEQVPAFNMRKFITQMLVSHNEYRAQHKAGPLRLNPQLNRLAQDWADVLAMRDKMAHDPNCAMINNGENVAMKFRIGETNFPGDVFTDMWYDEIDSYDWNSDEPQPQCGHFTQLVWKSTTEVGFGRAVSDTGRVYVVGRYKPPGNYRGEFKRNVLPSADDMVKAAGEDVSIVKEPMKMPLPISFATRDFGAAKRRSVAIGGGGGTAMRNLADFLPQGGKAGAGSPLAALLLSQTLQQSQKRAPEKATKTEENVFSLKKFENQLLVSHNEFRALHRSPPLRLNPELSRLAQAWAEVLASKDKMAHDPKCGSLGLGENVAMKFRKGFTNFPGDLFSELWYHEIDQYKWTGEDQLACGHFTQLVWRSSTEVGFGRAVSKSGRVYVVGRYRPPGNYSGQFGRNVLPPSRVMPKSRNNIVNRSNLDAGKNVPTAKAVPTASSTPAAAPVEYAGFGTAKVVDRRQGLSTSNLRALPLSSPSAQQQKQQQQQQQHLPNHTK